MNANSHPKSLDETTNERAVSPVIGVVLMVALTAILATVLATIVMDFTSYVEPEVDAGVTIDDDGNGQVTVTYTAEGTSDHVLIRGDCLFATDRLDGVGSASTEACSPGETINVVAVHDSGTKSTVDTHTVE